MLKAFKGQVAHEAPRDAVCAVADEGVLLSYSLLEDPDAAPVHLEEGGADGRPVVADRVVVSGLVHVARPVGNLILVQVQPKHPGFVDLTQPLRPGILELAQPLEGESAIAAGVADPHEDAERRVVDLVHLRDLLALLGQVVKPNRSKNRALKLKFLQHLVQD